ncbi:MAG: hypothetical protein ACRDPJ_00235, partial [Nocardioidaceae bacterium]
MRPLSIGTVALAVATLTATVLAAPTSIAASDAYGDTITVTFGANEHSTMPVTLDLPVPGDERRVASVRFGWMQRTPTYQGTSWGSMVVETPQCVADAACQVVTDLPTGRMVNSVMSSVSVVVSDGSATIGSTSRTVNIQNPKPTVTFTAPGNYDTFWQEPVTLAADATSSSSGAAIKGVRFYVNPTGEEEDAYQFDDTAPYSVTVPAGEIAESTQGGTLYAVAEDVEGNLSQYTTEPNYPMRRYVRVGPPPIVSWRTPAADGRPAGGMSTQAYLTWDTALPDTAPPSESNPELPYIDRV